MISGNIPMVTTFEIVCDLEKIVRSWKVEALICGRYFSSKTGVSRVVFHKEETTELLAMLTIAPLDCEGKLQTFKVHLMSGSNKKQEAPLLHTLRGRAKIPQLTWLLSEEIRKDWLSQGILEEEQEPEGEEDISEEELARILAG